MCKIITKGLVGLAPRRKRAGYTQKDFAEAMGVTQSVVARYETGEAWPSAANLPMMADLLGCSIDDLYERPEDAGDRSLDSGCAVARDDKIVNQAGA